jgi:hypothetical protein
VPADAPPIIIGSAEDEHALSVAAEVRSLSIEPIFVDAAVLESIPYSLSRGELTLRLPGGAVRARLDSSSRGWIRRLAPPHWRRAVVSGSRDAAIRGAWMSLVTAVAGADEVSWLTPLGRLFLCENKVRQNLAAERLGIATPDSAVVSNREYIPSRLGDMLVVKPLGSAAFTDTAGVEQVVWTHEMTRESPLLERLGGAPFLVQKRLLATRHLRVVTVERRSWACALDATDLPLDWRPHDDAHMAFIATSEPSVEGEAVRLAEDLGLGYSSQDWIVSSSGAYFLDLNPAGQWLFLPDAVATEVTKAIA